MEENKQEPVLPKGIMKIKGGGYNIDLDIVDPEELLKWKKLHMGQNKPEQKEESIIESLIDLEQERAKQFIKKYSPPLSGDINDEPRFFKANKKAEAEYEKACEDVLDEIQRVWDFCKTNNITPDDLIANWIEQHQ